MMADGVQGKTIATRKQLPPQFFCPRPKFKKIAKNERNGFWKKTCKRQRNRTIRLIWGLFSTWGVVKFNYYFLDKLVGKTIKVRNSRFTLRCIILPLHVSYPSRWVLFTFLF